LFVLLPFLPKNPFSRERYPPNINSDSYCSDFVPRVDLNLQASRWRADPENIRMPKLIVISFVRFETHFVEYSGRINLVLTLFVTWRCDEIRANIHSHRTDHGPRSTADRSEPRLLLTSVLHGLIHVNNTPLSLRTHCADASYLTLLELWIKLASSHYLCPRCRPL